MVQFACGSVVFKLHCLSRLLNSEKPNNQKRVLSCPSGSIYMLHYSTWPLLVVWDDTKSTEERPSRKHKKVHGLAKNVNFLLIFGPLQDAMGLIRTR